MLDSCFSAILNQNLTASIVIAYILVARLLLSKSDKIYSYALWAVVLFRLLCPFSFETAVSAVPNTQEYIATITTSSTEISPQYTIVENFFTEEIVPTTTKTEEINWLKVSSAIWAVGTISMLIYGVYNYIKLQKNLVGYTHYEENIYLSDNISSPFVMGIFKPKIFLPSNITAQNSDFAYNLDYIICHEKTHIKRLDHITRILGFVAVSFYWFNPLVWCSFVISAKDMEISCDQSVIKHNNKYASDIRKDYSHSLLYFLEYHPNKANFLSVTPHAFGDGGKNITKERITNIMTYKKPIKLFSTIALLTVILTTVALATTNTSNDVVQNNVDSLLPIASNSNIENELLEKFDSAFQTFKKIDMSTLDFNFEDTAIIEQKTYFAVTDFASLADFKNHLSTMFGANIIAELSTIDTLYAEQDGKLYVIPADRGSNILMGGELSRTIQMVDDNRAVIYVEIECNSFDEVSVADSITFQFICEKISDEWIFTQFPRIY